MGCERLNNQKPVLCATGNCIIFHQDIDFHQDVLIAGGIITAAPVHSHCLPDVSRRYCVLHSDTKQPCWMLKVR